MPDLSNPRDLARAATAIENHDPEGMELLRGLKPGHAVILGITGPPGAGKSTLVDAMARLLRQDHKTAGIIAVDPSSRLTGGAILGDRIRMQSHHADPGIFIRSMATRGSVGGLAQATQGVVKLLDASGKDFVIIETVGVGQAEVEIAGLADVTVVVLVPGMGDDVQAIKSGIMEIADIFVINKADHPSVERVEDEIRGMLSLGHRPDGWVPPVVRTVATEGTGVDKLLEAVWRYREAGLAKRGRKRIADYTIDHLGVAVRSVDTALKFYREQLGMAVSLREQVAEEKVNVAMLPVGESRIELLEPTEPDSVIGKFLEKRGEGLHHVALRVPDLAATTARLRAAGARLLNEPRAGAGGHLYVFVHPDSTGGVLLELIQEQPI